MTGIPTGFRDENDAEIFTGDKIRFPFSYFGDRPTIMEDEVRQVDGEFYGWDTELDCGRLLRKIVEFDGCEIVNKVENIEL